MEISCDDDLSTLYIYFNQVTLLSSLWETRAELEVGPLPVDPQLQATQKSQVSFITRIYCNDSVSVEEGHIAMVVLL